MTYCTPLSAPTPTRSLSRIGLLTLALAGVQAASAQAIYGATEHAEPNGVISVRGDGLDGAAQFTVYPYGADGARGAGVRATLQQANGTVAMVRIPATLRAAVYEIVATTASGATNGFFLNRPRLTWTDAAEAMPGGRVRVQGRGLRPFSGLLPKVTLTNSKTGATVVGTLARADDSSVAFVVPPDAPPGSYQISLNNGLSGAASADPNTLPITIKPKMNDPFGLGVSWGADLSAISTRLYNAKTDARLVLKAKGDGIADDSAAINAAIQTIKLLGGGTLYLPAGTYRVGGLKVLANVILKGEGKGKTVLQVGYQYTATIAPGSSDYGVTLWGEGAGHVGIADLTIQNVNVNAKPNGVLRNGPSYMLSNGVFMKNVSVQLNNGREFMFQLVRKAVIADCDIKSTCLSEGPIQISDVQELQFVRNTVDYRADRTGVMFCKRVVFEGNKILVDNAYHTPSSIETAGLETSFSQQILISDNDIAGYNGAITKSRGWDGEMVSTQASTIADYNYVGMVKSASDRLLVPMANWASTVWQSPRYAPLSRMAVMIVDGKGAGQWRWASAWTSSSVMVDRPWQVTPNATSRFTISPLSCYGQTVINNRISGGYQGIQFYGGGVDSVVSGNVLTNAGPISLRGDCRPRTINGSNFGFMPIWDVSVTQNSVSQPDGVSPACITAAAVDVASAGFGMMVSGVDIRYNVVTGSLRPWIYAEMAGNDGLEVTSVYYDGRPVDLVNNVGTIVEGNSVTKAVKPLWIRSASIGELLNNLVIRASL